MRRPDEPAVPGFRDLLESLLREEITRNPPRPARRRRLPIVRFMARPVMPGVMAFALAVALLGALRPLPTRPLVPIATEVQQEAPRQYWVLIAPVADPQPIYMPQEIITRVPRFVNFVSPTAAAEPDTDVILPERV